MTMTFGHRFALSWITLRVTVFRAMNPERGPRRTANASFTRHVALCVSLLYTRECEDAREIDTEKRYVRDA